MGYIFRSIIIIFIITVLGCNSGKKKSSSDDQSNISFSYNNHLYTIVKIRTSWEEAQKNATSMGGYLVEIGTKNENLFIVEQLQKYIPQEEYNQTNISDKSNNAYVWTGSTHDKQNEKWLWDYHKILFWKGDTYGSSISNAYQNWGTSQPHNNVGDLSASLSVNGWENGKKGEWRSIYKELQIYYIIEYDSKKNGANREYGYSLNNNINTIEHTNGAIYYPEELIKNQKIPFVLFSPGWGSQNHNSYSSLLTFIAKQGYAVIYAKDPAEVTTTILINRFQNIIDNYNFLDFSKFGVIGHSSGGGNTFNILKHFSQKGWGKNGNFILATAPWFAFDMKENDFQKIPSNSKIVIMQFAEDQTTDPRIPLKIYDLLNTVHEDNKDYTMIANANHGYIAGDRDYTLMQALLTPLDALMENVFNENHNAKREALENGNDNPYNSGLQPLKPSNEYNYPCNPPAESETLFSKILKDGINYCELPILR